VAPLLEQLRWQGTPNLLSPAHVHWRRVEEAIAITAKSFTAGVYPASDPHLPELTVVEGPPRLRSIVHRRRSAVDMDGPTALSQAAFYQILRKTLPGPRQVPWTLLPWLPQVSLVLFVHRVVDLAPGLYLLLRHPDHKAALRATLRADFEWISIPATPPGLPLYRLAAGDSRALARDLSCHQEIAADGCCAVAMLAHFSAALEAHGPWFYPRLYWECGLIGQVLYLEAYACGTAATGIGCFFDDPTHQVLGITDLSWQDLYHFTLGAAVEDPRLLTLPPYPGQL
jgi:hypothetical protein